MARLGSSREAWIACGYGLVVIVLLGGAFLGVKAILPPLADSIMRNDAMPGGKIQAGAARELPPIKERKADKSIYVPAAVQTETKPVGEPEKDQVEAARIALPAPKAEVLEKRPPSAPFIPPDIHRPQ
jgi:hypothetical protein